MPNVVVTATLAAGAGGTGSVDDESVSDVGFSIRDDVQKKALPEGEDDLVVVEMAETVTVVEVISCRAFTLTLREDKGRAVDISEVSRCIEMFEVLEKIWDRDRESAL